MHCSIRWSNYYQNIVSAFTPRPRRYRCFSLKRCTRTTLANALLTKRLWLALVQGWCRRAPESQALLRSLLHNFERGDVLLGDAFFFGNYFLLCVLIKQGIDGVFEQHGGRKKSTDFHRGHSLGTRDHIVVLKKPKRPDWMSQCEYDKLPSNLSVRELCTGGKARKTLVTTLLDSKAYPKSALKKLYRDRWQVELNFRHIKTTM